MTTEYGQGMQHLQSLAPVSLVTTGRTGSDLLQSLLDSHPEVVTFNGILRFYTEFVPNSLCLAAESFEVEDVLDEFVGQFVHRFKSRYDHVERKDKLGGDQSQALVIDTGEFRRHAEALLHGWEPSRRNLLLAIYGAYNLCLSRDLLSARILFHHSHHFDELDLFLGDFPEASVVVTTRDPRATFVSGIENWRKFSQKHDNEEHLYVYIKRILEDSEPCRRRAVRYAAVRLEDQMREDAMRAIASWLRITFRPSMMESTWGGMHWHGDRLSTKTLEPVGWSPDRTDNDWRSRLGKADQYVMNFLMSDRLRHYEYPYRAPRWWDALIVPVLVCLPMRYERRFFGLPYLFSSLRRINLRVAYVLASTPWYYLRRVVLFLRYYVRAVRGRTFEGPWIGGAPTGDSHDPRQAQL
jgi:hypothetical protein